MYKITCDGYSLLDTRYDDLILSSPRVKNEVNTVGEGSFTIYANHPNYDKLHILRSVVEVSDEYGVLFRGRITENTRDFYNKKAVDLEGAMAFFNDSVVRDYKFPDDFKDDADYIAAATNGNVVAFYLSWLISQHNAQVEPFQRFKLGVVTVRESNNRLERSDTEMPSTWEEIKAKLIDSSLGGFLCIRYEADGNYIDYLAEFTEKNTQGINLGENLLDITQSEDGTETYSAIIPRGAEIESQESTGEDYEGLYGTITNTATVKSRLTLKDLPDGDITDDIVKRGDTLYSKKAVAAYGWRYAPRADTLWEDVTKAANLQAKGVAYLEGDSTKLPNTITVTAADLHFSDSQIRSFRIYKKIPVTSSPHGIAGEFDLTAIDADLLSPQNTKITVGKTVYSLTALQTKQQADLQNRLTIYETKVIDGFAAAEKVIETAIEKSEGQIMASVSTTYATKQELKETASSFTITEEEIVAAVSGTYATKDELGNYTTLEETDSRIAVAMDSINLSVYYTKEEANKTFASTQYVDNQISLSLDGIDLSVYATKQEISDSGYVTSETVDNKISIAMDGIDLSVYATKSDLEEAVEGSFALEIVTAENGSRYSQLSADVDKIVFNTGDIEINTDSFTLGTDGKVTISSGLAENSITIADGKITSTVDYGSGDVLTTIYGGAYTQHKPYIEASGRTATCNNGYIAGKIVDGTHYAIFGMQANLDYLRFKTGKTGYLEGSWESDSAISTSSDRNAKHDIEALPDAYSDTFDNLRPCRFKYNNGTSDRYHIGFVAQEVEDAVISAGLTTDDFAAVCYVVDEGKKVDYSVRYTEIVALNTYEIQKLKNRIAELENLLTER